MTEPKSIMNPELAKQLVSFLEVGKASAKAEGPNPPRTEPKTPAKIYQLPIWPDPVRAAPNALLRSALFAGIHSKKRKQIGIRIKPEKPLQAITIAAQDGITIEYAGDQFNQYDADVFFEALHRARHHPLETECFFTGYSFLKSINRTPNNLNYEDLDDSLTRLRDGRVVVEWKIKGWVFEFKGGLIASYVREKTTKLFKIAFPKEIKTLFGPACWTQLEWEERMALKGKPLAQWLHSYHCTHAPRFPVSLDFLHKKSGSPTTLLKHFRTEIEHAYENLHEILGWETDWNGHLVRVKRPPSPSQARYLAKNRETQKPKRQPPKRGEKGLAPVGDLLPGILSLPKAHV